MPGTPIPAMADRIVDPWGARTPYPRGGDWPVRVDEHADGSVEQWVQSACVLCSHGCGLEIGVRDGRIVGVRGRGERPRQPRSARPEGPVRLAGEQRGGPAAASARAPRRRAARGELGRGDGSRRRALAGAARDEGQRRARLLHERPAVHRGLLHAGARRARWDRHEPPRRQHAPLHGDGGAGVEGDVRLRRPARPASTTSSSATRSCTSGSTRPSRRRCSGCTSSTGCAAPIRRARS